MFLLVLASTRNLSSWKKLTDVLAVSIINATADTLQSMTSINKLSNTIA